MGFSRQEYWSGVPLPSPESHSYLASLPCPSDATFRVSLLKISFPGSEHSSWERNWKFLLSGQEEAAATSRPHRLRKGALAAEVVAAPEVLSHRHDPGAPDGEGGGRPPFPGRAPLGTRGQELSCIVLPQRTNSSTVGLAWVAAFESKGRSIQYKPQLSMEFPEKSYFKTL